MVELVTYITDSIPPACDTGPMSLAEASRARRRHTLAGIGIYRFTES